MIQSLELSCFLKEERVLDLVPCSKEDLMEIMLTLLLQDPAIKDPAAVRRAVLEREHKASTAIGNSIAIPHGRSAGAEGFVVAFARIKDGMDFESDDGNPVKLVFMIVASDQQDKEYIKLLSRLMLRLRNPEFIDAMLMAKNSQEMYNLLKTTR
ncbi:MAG: PTS sugar transporter subunit IIA [Candidatus Cloacimonetes bacterium]|jgi:mannitol/fructose-specific phosphotransferase system IIA component (Ntr-type)|nr:PTS sugar transporter subunit IIA [Candidatus Cloacimonadota bacterium]MDY0337012.1 PTS sugar transporter subunit IIA [Candidatus Cloacimonadaceae bacterium]MCB5269091.1 PTS sugar transporter subunit IIA [Candidatus Cloacimonadota bacterium]MCK9334674.1 PTS sugar transporter subunit IIA [Candidatus Cloacimonadota bacterium]MDD2543349.1 PTS sugar transporter subunit IIA [Candidatus Cloacimonadota bacterium]